MNNSTLTQHHKLFSTDIGVFSVTDAENIKEGITDFYNGRWDDLNFNDTDKDIWDDIDSCPSLKMLHDAFLENASAYVNNCYDDVSTTEDYFYHERGWITQKIQNTGIPLHNHRLTSVVGVYYFGDFDDNAGDLHFVDPRTTIGWIHPDQSARHDTHVVSKPQNGTMLLFPGWLMHFSPPNQSTKIRLSVGTNINLKPTYVKVNGKKWHGDQTKS
jgi:uncharacterized protein (TIGR02466 family)